MITCRMDGWTDGQIIQSTLWINYLEQPTTKEGAKYLHKIQDVYLKIHDMKQMLFN